LAVLHDDVHELGQHIAVEFRVRQDGADRRLGSTGHRLSLLLLGALRAVLGAALLAHTHASTVERSAHRVVADAWQVLHTTAANEHHRVLLEVVAFATDIAGDFIAI